MSEEADAKRMRLRYDGVCRDCGTALPAQTQAIYERSSRTVRCLSCPSDESSTADTPPDGGVPGASARREYERRRTKREARIREKHPRLGGLVLAATEQPPSTRAWDTGAIGEERLGHRLNEMATERVRLLHDRRIPGSRANIDHIAVTPTGVYVIDAKRYKGRPSLRIEGGILRPRTERLLVGTRDCSKLVDGVVGQVQVVRDIVDAEVPIMGVLCFVEADWPLIGGAFTIRAVDVTWPRRLYARLTATGPHEARVKDLHRDLAAALPLA